MRTAMHMRKVRRMTLPFLCPSTGTLFLSTSTCDRRRGLATGQIKKSSSIAFSHDSIDLCAGCSGPVAATEPIARKPEAIPEPRKLEKIHRAVGEYRLLAMLPGEKKIIPANGTNLRTLKGRIVREAAKLWGRKYRIELLASAVRAWRVE